MAAHGDPHRRPRSNCHLPLTRKAAGFARTGLLAWLSAGLAAWALICYPIGPYWLALAAFCYLLVLQRWPRAWLPAVIAALPVLDFAPFSGRFFFDEFDLLVLVTVAGLGWRSADVKAGYRFARPALVLLSLFAASIAVSALLGSYPYPALDANAFSNYYSPYNALRVAKGMLSALLLLPFLRAALQENAARTYRAIALGMLLGTLGAALAIVWERLSFPGLWNFSSGYRVVGPFSGMHTGGAYVEAYFATAMPFVVWWTLRSRQWRQRVFGAAVFLAGCYAMLVTYARGGYVALALGMAILLLSLLVRRRAFSRRPHLRGAAIALSLVIGAGWFALKDTPMEYRFSLVQKDIAKRTAHWSRVLEIMPQDSRSRMLGMGLGSLPYNYYRYNGAEILSAYHLVTGPDNTYLALSGGDPLYFEQIVDVRGDQNYRLQLSLMSRNEDAELAIPVCRKWMLYSTACIWHVIRVGDTGGEWKSYSINIDTRKFREQPWYANATVKLSLLNLNENTLIGIDKLSLQAADGTELIRNGGFEQGMDHWFFAADNHLPWHFKNLWLQVYFEQGWLGLSIFIGLLLYVGVSLLARYREKVFPFPPVAAALTAFLTVGIVDSLFDFPRMSLMFYLLVACVLLRPQAGGGAEPMPR
ncbi:O-antigen ligase family protein [Undibacterium sp.]|uniref:O-antigen ligase family protein n=1 Tax=Undibacterium sp. TaxID=1914977 RepID=UPI002C3A1F2C|nr:O-antigen ligase family protein [Undibacterium sp.]HTD04325.1 O-antigen ligase family protein [Undibacterium sp.]